MRWYSSIYISRFPRAYQVLLWRFAAYELLSAMGKSKKKKARRCTVLSLSPFLSLSFSISFSVSLIPVASSLSHPPFPPVHPSLSRLPFPHRLAFLSLASYPLAFIYALPTCFSICLVLPLGLRGVVLLLTPASPRPLVHI